MTEVEFEELGDERAKAHETDQGGDRRENIENVDLVRGESEIFFKLKADVGMPVNSFELKNVKKDES